MSDLNGQRVLAVHPSPDLYGSDRVFVDTVRAMCNSGATVDVVLPAQGRLSQLLDDEPVDVHFVEFPILRKSLLSPRPLLDLGIGMLSTVRRLLSRIRSTKPDLLYVNTITLPHWLAASRWAGVPTICHVHEIDSPLCAQATSALLSPLMFADRLIVNSEATRQYVKRHLPVVGSRISLVYNGFPVGSPPPPPGFRNPTRFLLVGRLSPRKGQDVAIEAIAILSDLGYDVTLELVGDTFPGYEWFERNLRRQAASLGLADRIVFSGFQHDPSTAYASADVVLVPSQLESFGNVAVEGLAAGRPVIASAVGGLPEIVQHEVNGLLFPAGNARALATYASQLLSDPNNSVRMGAEGARTVRERFSAEAFGRGLAEVIATTCQQADAGHRRPRRPDRRREEFETTDSRLPR